MRKIKTKYKLTVSILLIVVLISSITIPAFADSNIISGSLSKMDSVLHGNPNAVEEKHEVVKQEEIKPQTITENITTSSQTDDPLATIKAKAEKNRKLRLHQQDQFNYNQKDVEELLLSGATLEDIYRSDEIGNQVLVNPKDLIDKKHQDNQSWDDIEADETTKVDQQLEKLMKNHTDFESKFAHQTISRAEQVDILQHLESTPDDTFDEVITVYKQEGRQGLQKLHDKKNGTKGEK